MASAEGKVKHCRITREGRMFKIGDADFESLNKLVDYYTKHPLYRKMKLRYEASDEFMKQWVSILHFIISLLFRLAR